MKVLAVCGFGVGSSMILKMSLEKAFNSLGVSDVEVDNTDINDARSVACDVIFTSAELCDEIKSSVTVPVYPVKKYVDMVEIEGVVRQFLDENEKQ
jgi:PTS system ascorbate-specific IIB component